MKKETISLSKRIWSKIRYYQMLYDMTESELAEIIHVTTRTLKTYDKDASNLTLGAIDRYLEYMDLSLEELYGKTKPVQSDISCIGEYYLTDDIRRKRKLFHDGEYFFEIDSRLGFKPDLYYISLSGQIYSKATNKILSPTKNRDGYLYCGLRTITDENKKISVAKVMLTTFRGTPPDFIADPTTEHINGIRDDNRITNLVWMERSENCSSRQNKGRGATNSKAKLTEEQVQEICELLTLKEKSIEDIASVYNVSQACIKDIKDRKNWTYISDQYDF